MTLKCFMLHLLFGLCIGSAQGADWPTYHGGADLRGFSAADLPESLQRLWIYNTNGRIDNPPVSDGVRIFATPGKGRVVALSIDGKSLWEKTFLRAGASGGEMPLRFDAPLLCHAGLVFSGSSRGTLLALDAATGEERWRLDTGGTLLGSPSVIDEQHIVILDQGEGILRCIDIRNGREVWATEGVARCDSSPGVGGGSIVFGSCLAALHVFNAADGRHLRDVEVGEEGQIAGGAAVIGNRAWFGTRDGRLVCVNLEKGTVIWSSEESDDQTFSTPAIADKRVVYTSDNGWIYAVDRAIGRTLWSYDTGGLPGSAVIAGDKVLVPVDGSLLLLSLSDGKLLWKQSISDEITSAAVIGNRVVVGADDGTISLWGTAGDRKDEGK